MLKATEKLLHQLESTTLVIDKRVEKEKWIKSRRNPQTFEKAWTELITSGRIGLEDVAFYDSLDRGEVILLTYHLREGFMSKQELEKLDESNPN